MWCHLSFRSLGSHFLKVTTLLFMYPNYFWIDLIPFFFPHDFGLNASNLLLNAYNPSIGLKTS